MTWLLTFFRAFAGCLLCGGSLVLFLLGVFDLIAAIGMFCSGILIAVYKQEK